MKNPIPQILDDCSSLPNVMDSFSRFEMREGRHKLRRPDSGRIVLSQKRDPESQRERRNELRRGRAAAVDSEMPPLGFHYVVGMLRI